MDAIPEVFVDRFGEVSLKEGMIRIELVSLSGAEPQVIQRLIVSVAAFIQMLQVQRNMVQSLEQAGVITVQPAAGATPAAGKAPSPGAAGTRSPNFPAG
jgi:hypothetical protein